MKSFLFSPIGLIPTLLACFLSSDLITLENHFSHPSRRQLGPSAKGKRGDFESRRERETKDARRGAHLRSIERSSERCLLGRRVSEKEDGEEKEIFGLRPPDQEQGCQGETRSGGGREYPGSGQAAAGAVGEDPRPPRRERPLPLGDELQVLSSEAEGAGGAGDAERGSSSYFENYSPQASPASAKRKTASVSRVHQVLHERRRVRRR